MKGDTKFIELYHLKKKKNRYIKQKKRRNCGWKSLNDCGGAGGGGWSGDGSQGQFSHSALQRVAGPVVVVPAQEPAGEGGRLEALLDLDDGRPAVSVGRIRLDVAHR